MQDTLIKIGADPFPPYQYLDGSGNAAGSDYRHITEAMRRAGWRTETVIDAWGEILRRFEKKELDAVFQVQDTPERLEKYFLSDLLREAETVFVTLDAALLALESAQALPARSLTLGVIAGFANGPAVDLLPESLKRFYPDTTSLLQGLEYGEVRLAVCDRGVMEYICEKEACKPVPLIIPALTFKRPLYVMFHDRALCDAYNRAQKGPAK